MNLKKAENDATRAGPPAPALSRRRALILLLVLLALAAALRFYRIGDKSLWLDEVMSVRIATQPTVADAVRLVAAYDVHPPLFPIIHFFWMRLGMSDGMARVPSAVFGVLAAFFACLLASRLYGRTAGLFAALLMALSAYNVFYSQEARNYSMIVLLTLVLSWLLIVIVQSAERVPWWAWIAYAVTGVACLYTLVTSMLVIISHWVIFLIQAKKTRRNLICGLSAQMAIGLAFLPWLPALLKAQKAVGAIAAQQGVLPSPGPMQWLDAFGQWGIAPQFILGASAHDATATLGAFVAVLMVYSFVRSWRNTTTTVALICMIFVPVALYAILPMKRVHAFDPKHLIFVQPLCMIAVSGLAWGASAPAKAGARRAVALLLMLAAANAALLVFYYAQARQKECWPDAARQIESVPKVDLILVNPSRGAPQALAWYYRGKAKIIAPELGVRLSPQAENAGNLADMIESYQKLTAEGGKLVGGDRVWLVLCRNEVLYPTIGLPEWFEGHMAREEGIVLKGSDGRVIVCALYRKKTVEEAAPAPRSWPPAPPALPPK